MLRNDRVFRLSVVFLLLLAPQAFSQQVSLSATSLSFSPKLAGRVSASQTLTVQNSGTAALNVSSVAASGGYSARSNCGTVAPGATCSVVVSFISALVGPNPGTITIIDNVPSSPQIVNLSGSTFPPLALSPGSVTFASVAVGATSPSQTLTLTNHGFAQSLSTIATSGDFFQSNNCPALLASGASCTISVTFHPTAARTIVGALSVAGSTYGVSAQLSGTGTGIVSSNVSLQPASLNFGAKGALDLSTVSKTVTLVNASSTLSLSIQNILLNGPLTLGGAPIYQIQSTTCKGMLAPGGQCQITVSVGNSNPFPVNAPGGLTILDSDPTSPQVLPLSVTESPEVTFTPATLTFAAQQVGTTSSPQIVTLRNNLDQTGVSLIPASVSGDYHVIPAGANPCGLSPGFNGLGSTCTLGVTFSPNHPGVVNGAVTFTFYPECNPEQVLISHQPCPTAQVINLTGTGQ